MRAFKTGNAESYDTSVEIAEGLLDSFFEDEAVRPFSSTSGNGFLMLSGFRSWGPSNNRKNAGDHSSHIPSKDPM